MRTAQKCLLLAIFFAANAFAVFAQSTCGNALCDPGENQCTCPADCGSCSGPVTGQTCRELACAQDLCRVVTTKNCCGNNACEGGETFTNCPADCAPTKIEANILYPKEEDYFTRGESILIKAEVLVDGKKNNFADINVAGFFGSELLFNDGKHGDGTSSDFIYANAIPFKKDLNDGLYPFTLTASYRNISTRAEGKIVIKSLISFEDIAIPSVLYQGNQVLLKGKTTAKGNPASSAIGFSLSAGKTVLAEKRIKTDSNGVFSISYPISFIDPLGKWGFSLKASDTNGNTGLLEGFFEARSFESQPLGIDYLSALSPSYKRGKPLEVIVAVKTSDGSDIEGARLELLHNETKLKDFFEFSPGKYSASVNIEDDFPEGSSSFKIRTLVSKNNRLIEQFTQFDVPVTRGDISLEVVEPAKSVFGIGETVQIIVEALSPNSRQVVNARLTAVINNAEIALAPAGYGVFSAEYVVREEDSGKATMFLNAVDSHGNSGSKNVSLEFSTFGLPYFISRNTLLIGITLFILLAILPLVSKAVIKQARLKRLREKKRELNELMSQLQEKYFKKKQISQREYKKSFDEITMGLLESKSELSKIEK